MKMKRIFNIISVAALVLFAASCDRKVEFQHESFASFRAVNFNVNEDGGSVVIPVMMINPTGTDTQISVAVTSDSAVEGTDFEVVTPANGILNFPAGTDSLAVEIAISKDFIGEFTGPKEFSLKIASVTEGVSVGNFDTASVTIQDLDHPLSAFFGTWTGKTFEEIYMGVNVTMSFKIAADPKDIKKLVIETTDQMMANVVGYTTPVILTADAEYKADGTGTIVIPNGQATGFTYDYGPWFYMGFDAASFEDAAGYENIVMKLNADGTMTVPNGFGIFDDQYIWASYVGGYTLTKN